MVWPIMGRDWRNLRSHPQPSQREQGLAESDWILGANLGPAPVKSTHCKVCRARTLCGVVECFTRGISFATDLPVCKGTPVHLDFEMPEEVTQAICSCPATVQRC